MAPDGTRIAYAEIGQGLPLVEGGELVSISNMTGKVRSRRACGMRGRPNYQTGPLRPARQRPVRLAGRQGDVESMVDDLEAMVDAAGLRAFRAAGGIARLRHRSPMRCGTPSASANSFSTAALPAAWRSVLEKAGSLEQFQALATLHTSSAGGLESLLSGRSSRRNSCPAARWSRSSGSMTCSEFSTSPQNAKKRSSRGHRENMDVDRSVAAGAGPDTGPALPS